ncbi:hypothetical protein COLO4_20070 [Corchorus olitorius]|uniref:Uncharacterized protein n=1 Tax=Corchorus olitorius TaxID=93759 RepID=A0A1R3J1U2_9ROSI|nr:hypothetical protein COLO4_20070 [Corchorus olitorius]
MGTAPPWTTAPEFRRSSNDDQTFKKSSHGLPLLDPGVGFAEKNPSNTSNLSRPNLKWNPRSLPSTVGST